jgi:ribonuclease HI
LWDRLLTLISEQQKVIFHWIKGHNGHPENERCDELASLALNGRNLLEDRVYMSLKYDNDLDENNRQISKNENSLF